MSEDLARRQASMFSRSVIRQSDITLSLKMPHAEYYACMRLRAKNAEVDCPILGGIIRWLAPDIPPKALSL